VVLKIDIGMKKSDQNALLSYLPGIRFWIISSGTIILFTALKMASHIVNIILLASFLTAISLAPLNWLLKKGVNKIVANFIIIFSVVMVVGLIGVILGASFNGFVKKMPVYEEKFKSFVIEKEALLIDLGIIDKSAAKESPFRTSNILPMVAPLASGFGSVLSGALLIFIFFIFMIFESEMFARKLSFISKSSSEEATKVIKQLRNYFGIKTLTSLSTGIVIGVMLWILGVDFPVLWGFLAFILNYIPSIGSFIAAIPAVFLAFVVEGPLTGIITVVGYLVFNTLIGNVIEPQLMGKNLGLSPLIVFFSMILFGFILGPIGMLIATPLAIIVKIIFDSREVTKGLGIMISDGRMLDEYEKQKSVEE